MSYKIVKSGDYRERRNFSSIRNSYELKDLLEIQKKSYNWFITDGIKEVFVTYLISCWKTKVECEWKGQERKHTSGPCFCWQDRKKDPLN